LLWNRDSAVSVFTRLTQFYYHRTIVPFYQSVTPYFQTTLVQHGKD